MNTRTVIVGVIILVVGIALFAVGAFAALQNTTIITTFNQVNSGEYASTEIMLNSTSAVVVSSPAPVSGLILSQDLNLVNSTNLSQYALRPNSSTTSTETYRQLKGDYYYVAFSSSAPNTKVVAASVKSSLIGYGVLVIAGIACFIAGIVVAIIGAVRKNKNAKKDDTYHHADELESSGNPNGPNLSSHSFRHPLWVWGSVCITQCNK